MPIQSLARVCNSFFHIPISWTPHFSDEFDRSPKYIYLIMNLWVKNTNPIPKHVTHIPSHLENIYHEYLFAIFIAYKWFKIRLSPMRGAFKLQKQYLFENKWTNEHKTANTVLHQCFGLTYFHMKIENRRRRRNMKMNEQSSEEIYYFIH